MSNPVPSAICIRGTHDARMTTMHHIAETAPTPPHTQSIWINRFKPTIHPLIHAPSAPPPPSAGCVVPARLSPRHCCGGALPAIPPRPPQQPQASSASVPPPPPRRLPAPPLSPRLLPPPARPLRQPLHLQTRRVRPRRRRSPCLRTLGWPSWRRRSRACRSTGKCVREFHSPIRCCWVDQTICA